MKKVGGGANSRVYKLATFDLKQNVMDAISYFYQEISSSKLSNGEKRKRRQEIDTVGQDILESLASVVEFDGFDSVSFITINKTWYIFAPSIYFYHFK